MTKKELIAALAKVDDDAIVMFGNNEIMYFGSFAEDVYINSGDDSKKILITNSYIDKKTPEYCEILHSDKK